MLNAYVAKGRYRGMGLDVQKGQTVHATPGSDLDRLCRQLPVFAAPSIVAQPGEEADARAAMTSRADLERARSESAGLRSQVDALSSRVGDLTIQLEAASAELTGARNARDAFGREVERLRVEAKSMARDFEILGRERDDAMAARANLAESLSELRKDVDALRKAAAESGEVLPVADPPAGPPGSPDEEKPKRAYRRKDATA